MHGIKVTHLRHHRDCLGPDDVEGSAARYSVLTALVMGPIFPVRLHAAALRVATRHQRRWIHGELTLSGVVIAAAMTLESSTLRYHVLTMCAGQALAGFFAVWTVHHHCDRRSGLARTLRNRIKSSLAFNMFFHLEHHLYPRVPTCRLPIVAERLERAVPNLPIRQVY